jgi:hypothetical protein
LCLFSKFPLLGDALQALFGNCAAGVPAQRLVARCLRFRKLPLGLIGTGLPPALPACLFARFPSD